MPQSPSTSSLREVRVAAAAGVRAGFQVAVHDVPARLAPDVHKSRENKPERENKLSFFFSNTNALAQFFGSIYRRSIVVWSVN